MITKIYTVNGDLFLPQGNFLRSIKAQVQHLPITEIGYFYQLQDLFHILDADIQPGRARCYIVTYDTPFVGEQYLQKSFHLVTLSLKNTITIPTFTRKAIGSPYYYSKDSTRANAMHFDINAYYTLVILYNNQAPTASIYQGSATFELDDIPEFDADDIIGSVTLFPPIQ